MARTILHGKSLEELTAEMEELKANIRQAERQANQALQALGKAQEEKKEQLARQALQAKERQKVQMAKLRLAFERKREIESFARRARSIMSQTPSGPSKTSGLPYQYMEQIKGLLSLLGLAPANWKMDKRLPSFRDFLQGLRKNYDLVVSPEVVNWMSGYPPVYEKGEKKGRVKTLAGLTYEEFSMLKEAFDNLVHIGHEQGGINKYRGRSMDKGRPGLDDGGKVLFQAPHISDFYDPCVEWNMDLPENAGTNLVNANDPAKLASWWRDGMTVKEALSTAWNERTEKLWIENVPALGQKIIITHAGLMEPTGRGNKDVSARIFALLPPLLENAKLLRSEPDVNSKDITALRNHHLYAVINFNSHSYVIQISVKEKVIDGKTIFEYHGHRVLNIKASGLSSSRQGENSSTIPILPNASKINIIDALDAVKNKGSRIPEHLRRFLEDIKMNPGNPDILYQAAMPPTAWRNSLFFDLLPWRGR
ncbi:MAG: hypothetical protein LBJ14_00960 [Desulfarculales bacterium]|nr:hypothetical protein [Desulfarculales bacterium]